MKTIAYVTIDEVNFHLAQSAIEALGFRLQAIWPRDTMPEEQIGAVVYDLDCLPQKERRAILSRLLAAPATRPTLVHSYSLDDSEIEALQANGVAVHRRFCSPVIAWVCRMIKKGWQLAATSDLRSEFADTAKLFVTRVVAGDEGTDSIVDVDRIGPPTNLQSTGREAQ